MGDKLESLSYCKEDGGAASLQVSAGLHWWCHEGTWSYLPGSALECIPIWSIHQKLQRINLVTHFDLYISFILWPIKKHAPCMHNHKCFGIHFIISFISLYLISENGTMDMCDCWLEDKIKKSISIIFEEVKEQLQQDSNPIEFWSFFGWAVQAAHNCVSQHGD